MKKRRITQCYFDMFLDNFQLLFHRIIKRVGSPECDKSNHLNIAMQELLYVMIHFDAEKFPQVRKGSFSSFLYRRVKGIIMHDTQISARHFHGELHDGLPAVLLMDTETPVLIEELMSQLTPQERDVMEAFCENKTLRETASGIGKSPCTISKIRKRAVGKLKRAVGV